MSVSSRTTNNPTISRHGRVESKPLEDNRMQLQSRLLSAAIISALAISTPTFAAATLRSVFSAAFRIAAVSSADIGSRPSENPFTSGVLPSSDTSDDSILM